MKRFLNWKFIVLMLISSMANAASLTPDQLRMVEQLSPQDKAALAQQYGASVPQTAAAQASIDSPQTILPRDMESSTLEKDVRNGYSGGFDKGYRRVPSDNYVSNPRNSSIGNYGGDPRNGSIGSFGRYSRDGNYVPSSNQRDANSTADSVILNNDTQTSYGADYNEVKEAFSDFLKDSEFLQVDIQGLEQFGYNLFAGVPTTFAPATDVPVPLEYVLGPGDELSVQMFGQKSSVFTLVVDREGKVAFPDIGPLILAGMSFSEAKAAIAQQVGDKMVGVTASISMGKLRSIRVFVLGEVALPGSYVVSGLATLSNALFASGGVKKTGSLRNIQLKRQGKLISNLDLYDFLLKGDTSKDVRLLPGDVVFIPPVGQTASIAGKVVRPAIYELKGKVNIGDMLKLAGGLLPNALKDKVLLERINSNGNQSVKNIALAGKNLRQKIQDGDMIKVFGVTGFAENPVLLIGNVKRPGKYAWKKGMRLKGLIKDEQSLLPETYMDYGLIEREAEGNREPELLRFDVASLLSKGEVFNLALKPRDKVYVFNRSHFRIAPKLSVVGSVKTPGEYELKKNMRVLDLVLAAGGLMRDSSLDKAELYRTDPKSKNTSMISFDLTNVMKGSSSENLVLQDLDRVVVHSVWEKKRQYNVSVSGEVMNPYTYPFVDAGMRLTDLIFAAGGVTEKALIGKAELTRFDVIDGHERESKHMDVDLAAALAGDEKANIELQPYDVLTVRQVTNWRGAEHVQLSGEVKFPGSYPVEDGEKLSDVIGRAGGFTDKAYLKAAVFSRESIRVEQQQQIDDMASRMEVEIAQEEQSIAQLNDAILIKHKQSALLAAKRVLGQMKATKAIGRLVVKLSDIKGLENSEFNLRLKDGDTLYVPKQPDEVMIVGQVYNTTALLYRKKYDIEDYVDAAGGVTRMADESRIYVVRANGFVERAGSWGGTSIYPGDAIVIPEELNQFNLLDSTLDWSRVLMQVGVGVASMKTIGVI
ncbi:MAG: SLBB domain-containing protein [Ghiorsea sp.]